MKLPRLTALLLASSLFAGGVAFADGTYQQTLDRRVYVWNPNYEPDDVVLWSGRRDVQHLATGEGSVAFYKVKRVHGMGANVPEDYKLVVRYKGTMIRGKLQGVVRSSDGHGHYMFANFVDGTRQTDWQSQPPTEAEIARANSAAGSETRTNKTAAARKPAESASAPSTKSAASKGVPSKPKEPAAEEEEPVAAEAAPSPKTDVKATTKSANTEIATAPSPKAATKTARTEIAASPVPGPSVQATPAEKVASSLAMPSPPKSEKPSAFDTPFTEPEALPTVAESKPSPPKPKATSAPNEKPREAAAAPSPIPSASAQPSAVAAASPPNESPRTTERPTDQKVTAKTLTEPPSQRSDYSRYLQRRTAADPTQAFESLSLQPQQRSSSSSSSPSPTPSGSP